MRQPNALSPLQSLGRGLVTLTDSCLDVACKHIPGKRGSIRANILAYCVYSLEFTAGNTLDDDLETPLASGIDKAVAEALRRSESPRVLRRLRSRKLGFRMAFSDREVHDYPSTLIDYFLTCCSTNRDEVSFDERRTGWDSVHASQALVILTALSEHIETAVWAMRACPRKAA